MNIQRSRVALATQIGCVLLMLGLLTENAFAAQNQPAPDWTLQIDEAHLTRDLVVLANQESTPATLLAGARVRNPNVELRNDQIVLRGDVEAGWLVQPAVLVATASVDGDRVLVRIRSARIGPIDLPQLVQRDLEREFQERLDQVASTNDVVVRSVRIGNGRLVATGTHVAPQRLGYSW